MILAFGLIGSAIGYTAGYAAIGYMVGSYIGSLVQQSMLPDINQQGPRLSDLKVQTSAYGVDLATVLGSSRISGNVIWASDIMETSHTQEVGGGKGKGGKGPSQSLTTYTYSVHAAVAICGPSVGVRRIWADTTLIYDASDTNSGPILDHATGASVVGATLGLAGALGDQSSLADNIRIYTGRVTQLPDPIIEAYLGAGNVPAYRDTTYVVFQDLQLEKFGNRLPSFSFEVVNGDVLGDHEVAVSASIGRDYIIDMCCDGTFIYALAYGSVLIKYRMTDLAVIAQCLLGTSCQQVLHIQDDQTIVAMGSGSTVVKVDCGSMVITATSIGPNWIGGYFLRGGSVNYNWRSVSGNVTCILLGGISYCEVWTLDLLLLTLVGPEYTTNIVSPGISSSMEVNGVMTGEGVYHTVGADTRTFMQVQPETMVPIATSGIGTGRGVTWCFDGANFWVLATGGPGGVDSIYQVDQHMNILTTINGSAGSGSTISGDIAFDGTYVIVSSRPFNFGQPVPDGRGYVRIDPVSATIIGSYVGGWGQTCQRIIVWEGYYYCAADDNAFIHKIASPGRLAADPIGLDEAVTTICGLADLTPDHIDVTGLAGDSVAGYTIPRRMTARDMLSPLLNAHFADGVESGAVMKFVKRGASPAVTIPQSDFVLPNNPDDVILLTRMQDQDIPREVTVKYLNQSADYQSSSQYARRTTTSGSAQMSIDAPITMVDDEAMTVAEKALLSAWVGRNQIKVTLPPKYSVYEPTDVVTIVGNAETYTGHIAGKTEHPNAVEFQIITDDPGIYSITAPGVPAGTTPGTIGVLSRTELAVLDCALLIDSTDSIGLYVAGGPQTPDKWGGFAIYYSTDSGVTWTQADAVAAGATLGRSLTVLASGRTDVPDETNAVTVRLVCGQLSSCTYADILNGATNACLIGSEVLQFRTATQNADGSYTLSGLMRGRQGTEWATHAAAGERFALLSAVAFDSLTLASANIGKSIVWKAVTLGDQVTNASTATATLTAERLKPLAPVRAAGGFNAAGDAVLQWTRRARVDAGWREGVGVALDDSPEDYEVDIMNGGAVARTITGIATTTTTYTAAQQTTDFGIAQLDIRFNVYQVSPTVGRGHAGAGRAYVGYDFGDWAILPAMLADAPISLWPMKTDGTDTSGHGLDMSYVANAYRWQCGVDGGLADFQCNYAPNGSGSGWLPSSSLYSDFSNGITIVMVVRSMSAESTYADYLSLRNDFSNNRAIRLCSGADNNGLWLGVTDSSHVSIGSYEVASLGLTGLWVMIAATIAPDGTMRLFRNGVAVGPGGALTGALPVGTRNGGYVNQGASGHGHAAYYGPIAIFNKVIPDARLLAYYATLSQRKP